MMLAGCGTKESGSGASKDGKTVIKVSGWPTTDESKKSEDELKDEFEKKNPDIIIEPDTWEFDLQSFYPMAQSGNLPTVYRAAFTEAGKLIDGGYSADVTDVMKSMGIADDIDPRLLKLVSDADGNIYSLPSSPYILGVACNIELMEAAGLVDENGVPMQPKDCEELREFAVKIKEATGEAGFIFPSASNVGGWLFMPVAWSYGAQFITKEDGKYTAHLDSDEAAAALEYIKDLKWKYDVLPPDQLIDYNKYYELFFTGKGGMLISAGDALDNSIKYEMDINKIGMLAIPEGPQKHITLLGGTLYNIAGNSTKEQIEASYKWFEFKGMTNKLTDDAKESSRKTKESKVKEGKLVGIYSLMAWDKDSEKGRYELSLIDELCNIDQNHVKRYNDSIFDNSIEVKLEEEVCAQDLYAILDDCIQQVWENEDADCKAILKSANDEFQKDYLDNQE